MQKMLYLFLGILLRSIVAEEESGSYFAPLDIATFVEQRCFASTSENDPQGKIKEFYEEYNYEDLRDERDRDRFCGERRYKLAPMMQQLTVAIVPCFPSPNETYIPDFIYTSYLLVLDFLCDNRTLEIYFSQQGLDCSDALKEYRSEDMKNCSVHLKQLFLQELITIDDMCLGWKSAGQCFDKIIVDGCPHFAAFTLLNRKFFRALGAVGVLCSAEVMCHGGVASMFVVLIHYINFLICNV